MNGVLRTLLADLIDYAGLFPPAALPMRDAVANYAAYRASGDAWALARFVVPVERLEEFAAVADAHLRDTPWRLSALAHAGHNHAIRDFNTRLAGRAEIDVVEARAATVDEVHALSQLAALATVYTEVPVRDDPDALVAAIAACGLRAKIRTGGVVADAFPTAGQVARFLTTCVRHRVAFKATAGLHHPLRGEYPLTYDAGAPRGTMFGFLNVILAAAFAHHGLPDAELAVLLEERDPTAIDVRGDRIAWRGHMLTADMLAADRAAFAISFGSCSFREPLDDLSALPLP
jgi:hypothetical protein